jgi:hypothetical protein
MFKAFVEDFCGEHFGLLVFDNLFGSVFTAFCLFLTSEEKQNKYENELLHRILLAHVFENLRKGKK